MLTRVRGRTGTATVVVVLMFGAGEPAVAQPPEPASGSASAPAARQLVQALEGAQLDSIAAKDSEGDDRFVAALFFPGRLDYLGKQWPMKTPLSMPTLMYRTSHSWMV